MAYRFVPSLVTLDDLEGHSPVAGLVKCNSANICATFHTVSTDTCLCVCVCVCVLKCDDQAADLLAEHPGLTYKYLSTVCRILPASLVKFLLS